MDDKGSPTPDFLWKVHSFLSEMSKFGDAKLTAVIGLAGVFVGFLLRSVTIHQLITPPLSPALVIGAMSIIVFMVGIGFGLAGIFPRLIWHRHGPSRDKGIIFWQAILAHLSSDAYKKYCCSLSPDAITDQLAAEIFMLADVVNRKFWCLEWTAVFVVIAGIFGIFHLVLV